MRDRRLASLCLYSCLLLLPLLPACSLVTPQPATLEGFSGDTLQQVRRHSAELEQLQMLDTQTPAQRQRMQYLRRSLHQFEHKVVRNADRLEEQDDWQGAQAQLDSALRILPGSLPLGTARQQLAERRQLHEERLRMELAIHQGEQLLKDTEAYQRLRQLQGPGVLNWLEMKNFDRKRRASAASLHDYARRAIQRDNREDYILAQRALKLAKGLYGGDLQLPENAETGTAIEQELALINRQLLPAKPQPVRAAPKKEPKVSLTELQQALDSGDLRSAQQHLNRLRSQAPQHPQLTSLQSEFRSQLNLRVNSALKRGNELYSQGEIERALAIWREAGALAPDNVELQANIVRAEKLLENLRALSAPASIER